MAIINWSYLLEFPIIDISEYIPQADEQMGTKVKFWLKWEGQQWLFKFNRKDYGEDWAEKIAGEFAHILQIPCPRSELAVFKGKYGVLVESFTHKAQTEKGGPTKIAELVHGNDLIALLVDPKYPKQLRMNNRDHTLDRIEEVLGNFQIAPSQQQFLSVHPEEDDAFDLFVGFLLLDALVSNTDRHHRNWGVRRWQFKQENLHLAPSFDHASSLGRNFNDEQRNDRLSSKDANFRPEAYAMKAPTRIYENSEDKRPFSAIEAYRAASSKRPHSGRFWSDRLANIPLSSFEAIIDKVPQQRMTLCTRDFCKAMIQATYASLIETE